MHQNRRCCVGGSLHEFHFRWLKILQQGIRELSKLYCDMDRVSAKRTLRCISRPDAARRLIFLGQLYMVIIDHIYKNQLHASTCRLEKFYMVEYWKICFYFPFLSFPILYHVKFGICFPRLLPF